MLRLCAWSAVSSALLLTAPAFGRSAGIVATECENCHNGGKIPTVTLTTSPANPAVGQPITITIGVSQANGSTAGFYLTTAHDEPGTFQALEAGTAVASSGVTHTMPRAGSGGVTTFKAQWTATKATGVEFDVFAVSANGDKSNRGDGAAAAQSQVLVGCTGATYYIDQDGDGYGSNDTAYAPRKDCSTPPGYAAMAGDCDDFQAAVHPNAREQCDLKDNDCNGAVDDNVVNQPFCEDKDGDGHGVPGGTMKMDCKPSPGFGDCGGDCDDTTAETHPGANEICDGRDNNCDGKIDEGVRMVCGLGLCARYAAGCSSNCTPGDPFVETCNGYDDDCDGVVDNGTNQALCGAPDVPCVQGKCAGTGMSGATGATGAGGSPGATGSGGAVSPAGSAPTTPTAAPAPGGCSISAETGTPSLSWSGVAALLSLLRLARRRSTRRRPAVT